MTVKKRTSFICDWSGFVSPDGFWPLGHSCDQAFQALGWMIETGANYHQTTRWGSANIFCLLSCKPTCVNFSSIEPIVSIADLERRFHHAILSRFAPECVDRWRKDHSIFVGGKKKIVRPHYRVGEFRVSEFDAKSRLKNLFEASGHLGTQLNEYHEDAREIYGVRAHYYQGWSLILHYGIEGCEWLHVLSTQRKHESFYEVMLRADAKLNQLKSQPLADQPTDETN